MILKSFEFHCDFDFQITSSKMILISISNHLYLGDLILILKSSTYDDFAHLWSRIRSKRVWWESLQPHQLVDQKKKQTKECDNKEASNSWLM